MRRRFTLDDDTLEEPIVNLTPLIDVVFVVLISFILIAPMLEIDNINLAVGPVDKKNTPTSTTATLKIIIKKDNSLWLQDKASSLPELKERLFSYKTSYPTHTPQLICDRDAAFGTYQSVKNALEQAGFSQMDLILRGQ